MIASVFSSELPINEQLRITKNVLSSCSNGKRICIVTGTHGDELEGQMVCYLLVKHLQENMKLLNGTIEVYAALNPLGIDTIQRGIPNFDLDLNRIFPGDSQGTMAEQAAYAIVEDLKGADLVIDIHSSNLYLRETPQVRINVNDEQRLVPLAQLLGVDFIWVHDAATVLQSTLAHSLNSTGTPCLVVEMGVGQRINHSMCDALTHGILNLMSHYGLWKGDCNKEHLNMHPYVCKGNTVEFLNAESSGIFLTDLRSGNMVNRGDVIGEIVEPLTGKVLNKVVAPCNGYMFTIRAYPIVYEGSLMARIYRTNQ